MEPKIVIKKSRNGEYIRQSKGANGRQIGGGQESFKTRQALDKNIIANMELYNGDMVLVHDRTGEEVSKYRMMKSGSKVPLND